MGAETAGAAGAGASLAQGAKEECSLAKFGVSVQRQAADLYAALDVDAAKIEETISPTALQTMGDWILAQTKK